MKRIIFTLALICGTLTAVAQKTFEVDLWQNGLPNSNGLDKTQPYDDKTRNFKPAIKVYLPADSVKNGMAILVCPGGGYRMLSNSQEGHNWAPILNENGIATIVLSYRMPMGHKEVPMSDATEAMRVIRENAEKWGINPERIGIMGHSAGGHLASTIATHSPKETCPNFQVLFYPVISMDMSYTHQDSHNAFLGENATKADEDLYSNQLQVTKQTPPAMIMLSDDDFLVPPRNSAEYYLALKKAGVKACLHSYPSGGHGWGCGNYFQYHKEMVKDLMDWLKALYAPRNNNFFGPRPRQ